MAPIIRVNSVAVSIAPLSTAGVRLLQDDFVSMLINCGYEPAHILGIQHLPHRKIVIIKFQTTELYTRFLELDSVLISGITCNIFDMSSNWTKVSVLGAPFEMAKEDLLAILGKYGRVHAIRQRMLNCSTNRQFNILPDGTWIANMDVLEHIPSYVLIGEVRLAFMYYGQPKTCRVCNSTGHLARDCKPQSTTKALTDPQAFPPLAQPSSSHNLMQLCVRDPQSSLATEPPRVDEPAINDVINITAINETPLIDDRDQEDTPVSEGNEYSDEDGPILDDEPQDDDDLDEYNPMDDDIPTGSENDQHTDNSEEYESSENDDLPEGDDEQPVLPLLETRDLNSSDRSPPETLLDTSKLQHSRPAGDVASNNRSGNSKTTSAPTPIITVRSSSHVISKSAPARKEPPIVEPPTPTRMQLRPIRGRAQVNTHNVGQRPRISIPPDWNDDPLPPSGQY